MVRLMQNFAVTLLVLLGVIFPVHAANVSRMLEGEVLKWQGKVVDLAPLRKFYKSRRGIGVWTDFRGLNGNGKALILLLSKAKDDGLSTDDYIRNFPRKLEREDLGGAELYLSQAFWRFGRDLYSGRATRVVNEPDIVIIRKKNDIFGWLSKAGRMGPAAVINSLRPAHQQYVALAKQLAKTKSKKKARKISVNMERWRWLPSDMGRRHVLVNQPAYEMYIRAGETIVDRRKVVVGKPHHKTPMFSYALKYAEFNPTWTVPRSIAGEEFLPKIRRNSDYLSDKGYKIFSSWEEDAEELDVKSINWSRVSSKDFPYRIVQSPGKRNALGKVKFMFPNRFKIYLHDTPSKKLFSRASRAYSHGCVRVEKPLEFATKLFSSQLLNKSKIDKILANENTTKVKLRKAVPIHLTYFTMWVEANGKLKSYKDVYNRDGLVANILFGRAS